MRIKKKKTRSSKIWVALLCILTMAASVMLATAENGAGKGSENQPNTAKPGAGVNADDYPAAGEPGHLHLTKDAQWLNAEKTEAEVVFKLQGQPVAVDSDVLVIMDRSGSMGAYAKLGGLTCLYCGEDVPATALTQYATGGVGYSYRRGLCPGCGIMFHTRYRSFEGYTFEYLDIAKTAASGLLNEIFNGNADHRMGLVTFSSSATTDVNFTAFRDQMQDKISHMSSTGETDYAAALTTAKTMIASRSDKSRPVTIVFVTDGEPNPNSGANSDESLIAQAGKLKALEEVSAFYAIGYNTNSSKGPREPLLKAMSSGAGYSYADVAPAELASVFTEIAKQTIRHHKNVVVTDYINTSHFVISDAPGSVTASSGEVLVKDNQVTWSLSQASPTMETLTIKVRFLEASALPGPAGQYATNGKPDATVTYVNPFDNDCVQSAESPLLSREAPRVDVVAYLVNEQGQALDGSGNAIASGDMSAFDKAHVALKTTGAHVPLGKHTYTAREVLGEQIQAGGKQYRLYQGSATADYNTGSNTQDTVAVTSIHQSDRVTFAYYEVVPSVSYTVTVNTLPAEGGAASASAPDVPAGRVITVTAGESVQLHQMASRGWVFRGWTVNTGLASLSGDSFIMPAGHVELTAVFAEEETPPAPENTLSLHLGKRLINQDGATAGDGKRFAVRLYDNEMNLVDRVILSANQEPVVIPGLKPGAVYTMIEENAVIYGFDGFDIQNLGIHMPANNTLTFRVPAYEGTSASIQIILINQLTDEEIVEIPDEDPPLSGEPDPTPGEVIDIPPEEAPLDSPDTGAGGPIGLAVALTAGALLSMGMGAKRKTASRSGVQR